MIELSPNDACPCESGRILRECCLGAEGDLRPVASVTRCQAPKTGAQTKGCYAAALADCSADLSREHFISRGVLKELSDGGTVRIDGFPWQTDRAIQRLPTAVLGSNILCRRHNIALSTLDAVALRFFRWIDQFHREFDADQHDDRFFLVNGHDIERWMLKTLCGAVFSKNATINPAGSNWVPPMEWVQILFGEAQFPVRCGVYISGNIPDTEFIERGYKFVAFSNGAAGVYGARISMNDETFVLAMSSPPEDLENTFLANHVYRPRGLALTNGCCEKITQFGWDDGLVHRGVRMAYEKSHHAVKPEGVGGS
ncbi:MAG: SEC-C domain-containing protein [Deltaproteobacteria bacterium]|nr:SEC-C domain-containing protein [Deltaproteobacteria bacterium]